MLDRHIANIGAQIDLEQYKKDKIDHPLRPLWIVTRGWGHPGYTWYAVASDGALLCEACCRANYRQIAAATLTADRGGWAVVGVTYDGEMEEGEACAHCGKHLGPEAEVGP